MPKPEHTIGVAKMERSPGLRSVQPRPQYHCTLSLATVPCPDFPMQFRTRAIHVGNEPDPQTGAVVPPIHLATTFVQPGAGDVGRVRLFAQRQSDAQGF